MIGTMEPPYDCIVVGAGPAGASTAYHLARRGHRVALLERAAAPGLKPCGGGVSPQVQKWFDFDFSPVIGDRVRRCRFSFRGADPVDLDLEGRDILWLVRRERFDRFLVDQARGQGAELHLGRAALGMRYQGGLWEVATEAGPLAARYVVAADGAKGRAARQLGLELELRPAQVGVALEAECPAPAAPDTPLCLDLGGLPFGYQWNFPKLDGQSLGIGTLRGRAHPDLRGTLARYAAGFGVDLEQCRLAAHPVHVWHRRRALHGLQALVVGEAACLVDPFTVEGIRPAMGSGVLAAEALDRALQGQDRALEGYSARVEAEWGADLVWARRLAQVFFRAPASSYRLAVMSPGGPRVMARLLMGELRYSEVVRRAIARLLG